MSDIVERLWAWSYDERLGDGMLLRSAADEIERLQARLAEAERLLQDVNNHGGRVAVALRQLFTLDDHYRPDNMENVDSTHRRLPRGREAMTDIVERITAYLSLGGLFNPELADHQQVANAPENAPENALEMARFFHDAYERLAPAYGYETRMETRQFDPTTPNGRLMVAVCRDWLIRHEG